MYFSKGRLASEPKSVHNEMPFSKLNMKKKYGKKNKRIRGIRLGIFDIRQLHELSYGVIFTFF